MSPTAAPKIIRKIVTIEGKSVALRYDPLLNCWFSVARDAGRVKKRLEERWESLASSFINNPGDTRKQHWSRKQTKEQRADLNAKEQSYQQIIQQD